MRKLEGTPCNHSLNMNFLIARPSQSTGKRSEKDLSTETKRKTSKEHLSRSPKPLICAMLM
jgi:hypothetical protein